MARRKLYFIADGQTVQGSATPAIIIANGNYPATPGWIDWEGGYGSVMVAGTFDSATVKLQIQLPDGSTWVDIGTATNFTATGIGGFLAPAGRLRVNVAGIVTASSLKAWVVGIPANIGG